jgi:sugar porter (SP) family MFS transporter
MEKVKYNYGYIWLLTIAASMGGFLFGYDWVVVGGAKSFYEPFFGIENSPLQQGWGTSSALIGCMIGALFCFLTTERWGRKWLIAASGIIFIISAFGTALSDTFYWYNVFRIVGGFSIGITLNLSPVYISEMVPPHQRGKFVSINQLLINVGILTSQSINWSIAAAHDTGIGPDSVAFINEWNVQTGWRWMFGAVAVPSLIFFILMIIVPESVRWLVKNKQYDKAEKVLAKIGGGGYAKTEMEEIKKTVAKDDSRMNFGSLLEPKMMKILLLAFFIALLQQWSGMNVTFYYAADIFRQAGYDISGMMLNIAVIGLITVIFSGVAVLVVDKLGRKKLMLFGTLSMGLIYGVIGFLFLKEIKGIMIVAFTLLNVAVYSLTLAPVMWVILSEIFPNRIRGAAMSITAFVIWIGNFSLTFSFPTIRENLGWANNFWLYGVICLAGFVILYFILPETKNKTLEQIEKELVG